MTLAERSLRMLSPVLGDRLAEWIRSNLPSRKPQLWEHLPRALYRRTDIAWHDRFNRSRPRRVIASLPEFGIVMELAIENRALDLPVFQFGIYEISGTRFLQNLLEPGMTVIDVGANSGYYSLIAGSLVGPEGHVLAFEPAAGPFEKLKRNVALNSSLKITMDQAAIGNARGEALLYTSITSSNDGLASLSPGPNRSIDGTRVPVLSLDEVIESRGMRGNVALVKVDVEGAESEVLDGARNLLSQADAPALLFESFNVRPIADLLTSFGYEVRHVQYSLPNGLAFPRVGASFDNLFAKYEAPNFVALKPNRVFCSFDEISKRSQSNVPPLLRLLARLA